MRLLSNEINSWNVNWLGNLLKCKKVKEVISRMDPDIVFSKKRMWIGFYLEVFGDISLKTGIFLPSSESLGGLLVVWDIRVTSKMDKLLSSFSMSVLLY